MLFDAEEQDPRPLTAHGGGSGGAGVGGGGGGGGGLTQRSRHRFAFSSIGGDLAASQYTSQPSLSPGVRRRSSAHSLSVSLLQQKRHWKQAEDRRGGARGRQAMRVV